MNAVIQYIERYLSYEINPEMVAKANFISLRQLYRDFYAYTGHSIKEYIRNRRISNVCEKIKCSTLPLAVISNESCSKTQQAFHKQFKSIVGMTPLEYRQSDTYFYFYPFVDNDISIAVKVGNEKIPECTTTRFYDTCLIGIEDKAIASLGKINRRVFGRNGLQINNRFCYEIMIEKDADNCGCQNKAGSYASCVVEYNEHDINDGWNYLYNIWLPTSMFEQSQEGYFEEYLFRNGKPYKLKLYLPVRKRKKVQHFTISEVSDMTFVIARENGKNAEHKASERVINQLQEYCPMLLRNAQRFFLRVYGDVHECGIECGDAFKLPDGIKLGKLQIPGGIYAVLPDDCIGDMLAGSVKMDKWLQDNSIAHEDKPVFALYEKKEENYNAETIQLKLYKRLTDDKIG